MINFKGGIISPGYLKDILDLASEAHVACAFWVEATIITFPAGAQIPVAKDFVLRPFIALLSTLIVESKKLANGIHHPVSGYALVSFFDMVESPMR